jgi:hypothetical protein
MWGQFTEYSNTGLEIQKIIEIVMDGIERRYGIRFKAPRHDIARRLLNEIEEFTPEAVRDHKAREKAAEEAKGNADQSRS